MKARDIMTPNPTVITPFEPISRAAEIMRDLDVGVVPVVRNRKTMALTGLLTDRDIAVRCVAEKHPASCVVRDHMTAYHLESVDPDTDVYDVIARMERRRIRRMPVVEDGRLVGIIAQADLAVRLIPKATMEVEHLIECISEPLLEQAGSRRG